MLGKEGSCLRAPTLRPRTGKQKAELRGCGGRRGEGKHAAPAAPASHLGGGAPALLAALGLAGGGGGKRSPAWCYWADLEIFGGDGGRGPRAHAPASGGERAQGLFCDAGFQFASAGALGHGVSCSLSHAAIWATAIGGTAMAGEGGLRVGARLNVPIVPPGREQEALASPWHLPGALPGWGPREGDEALSPGGYLRGEGRGNGRGERSLKNKKEKNKVWK